MRGYDRDEMDEYGEDGYDQEDEELEEYEDEEEVEEEERKPTKEELDYLGIRQRLKEKMRKQMKKESGASLGNSQEKKKLPYDNYGSFFGPSQPVIAQRVIQESKSLLENPHLSARISNSHHNGKKSPVSAAAAPRPGGRDRLPKVVNPVKQKVQKLKDMRDYSFLFSDDAELPAPTKEPPPRNVSIPNSDARPAQVLSKGPKSVINTSRSFLTGHEERKHVSVGRQIQSKAVQHKVAPGSSRLKLTLDNPKKQLGSSTSNGPGRTVGTKGLPSKMPVPNKTSTLNNTSIPHRTLAPNMDKKASIAGVKKPMPGVQKAPLHKSHSSMSGAQKAPLSKSHASEQRREIRDPDRARLMSKQLASSSRPQMKPPKQIPLRAPGQMDRPKKRPTTQYSDEDEGDQAISMIRNMFRYNPKKYAGVDEDDSDMEANFDDILKEERRSSKIAREEDLRELQLIEEEERRERMRKEAKRRKLSQ